MLKVRRSEERGKANHGWLNSAHTFSFANYHDPKHMGFSVLRVINEDHVAAGAGFGTHGHRDMEILTYVVDGALEHKDSMGNSAVIKPGEIQTMSAGTGVQHSEFNHSKVKPVHFLQIWILPDKSGHPSGYGQKNFSEQLKAGTLTLLASATGRDGSVKINQDTDLYALKSEDAGERILNIDPERTYWFQVIKGFLQVNDEKLVIGDGLAVASEQRLHLRWKSQSEFLMFEMPI